MPQAPVVLFSDFTCPFSYVTETALRRLLVEVARPVDYRAYELFPTPAPLPPAPGLAEAEALRGLATELGIEIGEPRFLTRTGKAHEASRFARARGFEGELREAIFHAYWLQGQDIGRIDVLTLLPTLGDMADELKIALDIDAFAAEVAGDRRAAERLGVRFTPTLIVGSGSAARYAVGAQPLSALRDLLAEGR